MKSLPFILGFLLISNLFSGANARETRPNEELQKEAQKMMDQNAAYIRILTLGNIWAMAGKYQLFGEHIDRLSKLTFDGDQCVDPGKSFWGCPNLLDLHDIYGDLELDLEAFLKAHKKGSNKLPSVEKTKKDWEELRKSENQFRETKAILLQMLTEGKGLLKKELERVGQALPGSSK